MIDTKTLISWVRFSLLPGLLWDQFSRSVSLANNTEWEKCLNPRRILLRFARGQAHIPRSRIGWAKIRVAHIGLPQRAVRKGGTCCIPDWVHLRMLDGAQSHDQKPDEMQLPRDCYQTEDFVHLGLRFLHISEDHRNRKAGNLAIRPLGVKSH
ncbi:hypothetical protein BS47DRAFT_692246 [Hydnum rufescens UP504]|uniref:Uncharacterized protein n=1 Tax=Hydnum rufescens UP504 TaxID=1448309 RepID=A0A9P6DN66_9AGAM|nr:hypothetical protein BS47DRAFT_692246 [Hydnum rufescens UP504]